MHQILYLVLFMTFAISACQNPHADTVNKFADTIFIKIKDFQDRRLSDSLVGYFTSSNDFYRIDAALAFASIQDSTYTFALGKLLIDDTAAEVRKTAAFALGQTACRTSEMILLTALEHEKDKTVISEILAAYGKVAKVWTPQVLPIDTLVQPGLAWSFYRLGLNGMGDSLLNANAASLLNPAMEESARLGVAHYFSRGAEDFEIFQRIIIASAQHDRSVDVRMAATLALGKINTDSSRIAAQNILQQDKDYRVRINAIRALQSFPLDQTSTTLILALHDKNNNAAVAASEVIKVASTNDYFKDLVALARKAKNWRIQATLYEAALNYSFDNGLAKEIMDSYSFTENPYHKAALLIALQHSISAAAFVQEQFFNSPEPVIKLAAVTSLVAMNYDNTFKNQLKRPFAAFYIKAINTGDPAAIGTIAAALADPDLGYKNEITNFSFLYTAKERLSLPKQYEAMQPLLEAIAHFEGKTLTTGLKNKFGHPIDWSLVKRIPRAQEADITTTKGNITIRLFVEEAPGSVANFVQLVKHQYFNNKYVHRVVPNFVVQTGCNRGDGWGSEDYAIRSEFSQRRYKTGSVGMASAGKDTEGTQWFITHSPTPHLDGRYTIFAEVVSGLEVVHQIEVGDKIINIELK